MWRAIWLFIKIGIAVAVAVWLAERPGLVVVDWQGWHLEASVGFVALMVFLIVVVAALTYHSWRSIRSVPRRVVEARRGQRRAGGYRALTLGMVAVAAGDVEEARRQAKKAEGLLDDRPLTQLLTAQSAQLGGDEVAAQRYFKGMLEQPETEFLGLRGLITQALKGGDKAEALTLAERANRLRPGTPWVLDILIELRSGRGDWRAAQLALEEGLRRKAVAGGAGTRSLAALIMERARESERNNDTESALQQARRAHDLDNSLTPAAVMVAQLQNAKNNRRRARKVLEDAWAAAPHPDLAATFLEISGEADSLKRVAVLEKLAARNSGAFESRLAMAEAMLDAALWGEARKRLQALAVEEPSARLFALMARLEEGEGKPAAVRDWLDKAAGTGAGAGWICGDCGARAIKWAAVCGNCGSLGDSTWRSPPSITAGVAPGPLVGASVAGEAPVPVVGAAGLVGAVKTSVAVAGVGKRAEPVGALVPRTVDEAEGASESAALAPKSGSP